MLIKIDFTEIPNSKIKPADTKELFSFWNKTAKSYIEKRINHYENVFKKGSDEAIFAELAFCIFTPQSKALSCWKAINILYDKNLLFQGTANKISQNINNVRFQNNKAKFLVEARKKFTINGKLNIKNILKSFDNPQI